MREAYQLNADTDRAAKAKDLLENELLEEAFAKLKEAYFAQLMATNVMQSDVREKCYLAIRVVDVVRDHLGTVVSNGKIAEADLKELAKVADRPKRFGVI